MKKCILLVCLITSVFGYSQRKSIANRFFNEFAYKKSAELYESIYKKGDTSKVVVSRLGDSYYYNVELLKAEKWYAELMNKYESIVSPEYIFRYAQVLKSNGKVEESDEWLAKLSQVKNEDSRPKALEENKDYFIDYTNRKKTYVNINNLSSNTKYSDFGGFLYGNKLYFASTKPEGSKFDKKLYSWNEQPFLNIYSAEESLDNEQNVIEVKDVKKLEGINTRYHESNIVITKNGKTIYFTRNNFDGEKVTSDKNKVTNLKIFKADNVAGEWKNVRELPFNSDDFSCGHPALSPDEKTLYFVSDMNGGFGATDIYKVAILGDDNYGEVENLGAVINTEARESFPFVDIDGTMYFSSDGHLGLGALDVFESKQMNGNFTKPKNLGTPVNGPLDDFSFVINDAKSSGFFSSNRKGGKGDDDIYSFIIYFCKENIKGIITDVKTGQPISDVAVRLINDKGEEVLKELSKENGSYVFEDVDCEKTFTIAISKEGYRSIQKNAETLDVNNQLITANVELESLIVEDQIVINPIYFDFDLYNIREDAEYELEHIVSILKKHPDMVIKIESHTDSRGPKDYNRKLSDQRAKSTRDYILARGINTKQIESAIGYGEDQLLNDCDDSNQCSKEKHQENRRSYFYIIKKN
ncbi:PD40 domain-containing protein [Tenacibaculum sp. S7007]|uniref:PD40 domain-containing protein n=1 Tax=Tenacibaculum pelagium TaxID=2759527 RepID=A0A839AS65_9FLAO|nr:OmpA family protein [Tenacibaculum pelagium]MBA6157178.1 PD40 domain-containing protein [Tenacibaculum pelagium]